VSNSRLATHLASGAAPIVAILRGVQPDEAVEIGHAVVEGGIRIVEVPLNSPHPLESVQRLRLALPEDVLVGVGTVLMRDSVRAAAEAGAELIVTPNTEPAVIREAITCGLDIIAGCFTATEAFAAYHAGARHLKLFPASSFGPRHLKALREVLFPSCLLWAVGGIDAGNLGDWLKAGAAGVGVGGSLYTPGTRAGEVRTRATAMVDAWHSS
jgi:2-dehydro-3-deoxyphosphogalactonate aldolase